MICVHQNTPLQDPLQCVKLDYVWYNFFFVATYCWIFQRICRVFTQKSNKLYSHAWELKPREGERRNIFKFSIKCLCWNWGFAAVRNLSIFFGPKWIFCVVLLYPKSREAFDEELNCWNSKLPLHNQKISLLILFYEIYKSDYIRFSFCFLHDDIEEDYSHYRHTSYGLENYKII